MLARHAPARALSSDRASTIHARPSAACVGGGRPGPSTLDTRLLRHLSVYDAGATASIGPAPQRTECTAMPTEQVQYYGPATRVHIMLLYSTLQSGIGASSLRIVRPCGDCYAVVFSECFGERTNVRDSSDTRGC